MTIEGHSLELANSIFADINAVNSAENVKPKLAHYTSLSVAQKIIENEEIWFSNPLLMNDHQEIKFSMNSCIKKFYNDKQFENNFSRKKDYNIFMSLISELYNEYDHIDIGNTYVFCTSDHSEVGEDGLLSMWRGYGGNGNGVAIVFRNYFLEKFKYPDFISERIKYTSEDAVLDWASKIVLTCGQYISSRSSDLTLENMQDSATALFEKLKTEALFVKHRGFSEEREWRVAYVGADGHKDYFSSMFSYHFGSQGLEPKMKVEIPALLKDGEKFEDLIEKIIIGPAVNGPMTKFAFDRFLEVIGKPNLKDKVLYSGIPYRPK